MPPRPPALFSEAGPGSGLSVASREEAVDETYLQKLLPFRLNARGPAVAVGDIFGEGGDDVVIAGTTADPLRNPRRVSPASTRRPTARRPPRGARSMTGPSSSSTPPAPGTRTSW